MPIEGKHYYLLGAGVVLMILFMIYAFVIDHKVTVTDDFSPGGWVESLRTAGLTDEEIAKLKHDDTAWYHDGVALCVGYGDESDRCPRYENYCAGGKTYGSIALQSEAIKAAIDNKSEHPECPLLYMGTN